jgi:hypothetical protein
VQAAAEHAEKVLDRAHANAIAFANAVADELLAEEAAEVAAASAAAEPKRGKKSRARAHGGKGKKKHDGRAAPAQSAAGTSTASPRAERATAPLETSTETKASVEAAEEPPTVAWAADAELNAELKAVQLGLLGAPIPTAHADATATNEAPQKLAAEEEVPIPTEYICPITSDIMDDPVFTADGHTYERTAIALWLTKEDTSPLTGATLKTTELISNFTVRSLIRAFKEKHPEHAGRA